MATNVRRALYGKLVGDGTLIALLGAPAVGYTTSVYDGVAPDGAKYPLVIFTKQSGTPTEAMGDPDAFDNDIWLVKGVDQSASSDVVEAIQLRCQQLLNDASLSISGATLVHLRRQSDVSYPEEIDGEIYRHAGALYRLVTV